MGGKGKGELFSRCTVSRSSAVQTAESSPVIRRGSVFPGEAVVTSGSGLFPIPDTSSLGPTGFRSRIPVDCSETQALPTLARIATRYKERMPLLPGPLPDEDIRNSLIVS